MITIDKIGNRFTSKLENIAEQFFAFWDEHKVGILGTIVVHLLIIILFLANKLESNTQLYISTIVVDMKKDYTPETDKIKGSSEGVLPADAIKNDKEVEAIRNFAVDATESDLNPGLTDDKNINASELYNDASRLKEKMDKNKETYEVSQSTVGADIPNTPQKNISSAAEGQYKGPAVISYYLKDRKAIWLPVPAYKCQFGGQVVVDIEVDGFGAVKKANIDEKNSVKDDCINSSAIHAAMESTFTSASTDENHQKGSITYLFVPQ